MTAGSPVGTDPLEAVAWIPAPAPLLLRPAWQLRAQMVAGDLPVVEVILAHLDRLVELQPSLNATVATRREAALLEAGDMQRRIDAGAPVGPLAGVPFTVKDVIATVDMPSCCGSAAFADNMPVRDATAVARLRAAGAILIAKTNCPEFAFGVTTENVAAGVTRNPWGSHSPGGSSGGEAALVAAGGSALGLGTDYGGSLRWPAQCCGVLALRPGVGRVDGAGQLPGPGGRMDGRHVSPVELSVQQRFQVIGPVARTVRDLAIAFEVIEGQSVNGSVFGDSSYARRSPAAAGLRIGWTDGQDDEQVSPDVAGAVRAAVGLLTAAGAETTRLPRMLDGLHPAFNALRDTDPLADLSAAVGDRLTLVAAEPRGQLMAAPISGAAPGPLLAEINRRREDILAQLVSTPVLLAPVAPVVACALDGTADVGGRRVGGFALMAYCRAVSALGLPAVSVPVALDSHGLPIAVQLLAGPGQEKFLLEVAARLEQLAGGRPEPPWLAAS